MTAKADLSAEARRRLQEQLVKLGDMIGDGLHLERGGRWIAKEYRQTAQALGLIQSSKRRNNSARINELMAARTQEQPCLACSGALVQVRSGSMVAKCECCGGRYKLLRTGKGKPAKSGEVGQ